MKKLTTVFIIFILTGCDIFNATNKTEKVLLKKDHLYGREIKVDNVKGKNTVNFTFDLFINNTSIYSNGTFECISNNKKFDTIKPEQGINQRKYNINCDLNNSYSTVVLKMKISNPLVSTRFDDVVVTQKQ